MNAYLKENLNRIRQLQDFYIEKHGSGRYAKNTPVGGEYVDYIEIIDALGVAMLAIRTLGLQADLWGFEVNETSPEDIVRTMCGDTAYSDPLVGPGTEETQLEMPLK